MGGRATAHNHYNYIANRFLAKNGDTIIRLTLEGCGKPKLKSSAERRKFIENVIEKPRK